MNTELEKSAAWAALGRNTKRIYAVIRAEIGKSGTGSAAINTKGMMAAINSASTAAIAAATRELRALGFISTTTGHRGVFMFELTDGWRTIVDQQEAKRLAAEARVTQKRGPQVRARVQAASRKPLDEAAPVETEEPQEPSVRRITLPVLAWPMNPNAGL